MKIINCFAAITLLAASAEAFAPSSSVHCQRAPITITGVSKTTLFAGQNDDFEKEPLDAIQEKAEEAMPQFLAIDIEKAQDELAKNWGWIVGSGVFSMALGAAALLLPTFATGVAYDGTVLTTGAVGFAGLLSAFKVENGQKLKTALSGIGYVALAYYMSTNPGAGLNFLTLTIAAVIASEGLFETAVALKNKNLEGRGWHFVSGLGSVLASLWLTTTLPVSGLFAPGVALGTRLSGNGARKVAVGLAGKELASQRA